MSYRLRLPEHIVRRDYEDGGICSYWLPLEARGNYEVIWDTERKENPEDEAIYFEFQTEEEAMMFKLRWL